MLNKTERVSKEEMKGRLPFKAKQTRHCVAGGRKVNGQWRMKCAIDAVGGLEICSVGLTYMRITYIACNNYMRICCNWWKMYNSLQIPWIQCRFYSWSYILVAYWPR